MKYLFTLLLAAVFSSAAFSQSEVKIGKQVWMTKNLDVDRFRNGDVIPEVKNAKQWIKASKNKKAAFCYYDHDPKNGAIYGKLYNWYAVKDSRGLAPKGYHIPNDAEWTVLAEFLGGEYVAGEKLKSTSGWANGGNGDNSSGFNGLPGGYCGYDGLFASMTEDGYFWSSSEYNTSGAWGRSLSYSSPEVGRSFYYKYNGLSVRCLRD